MPTDALACGEDGVRYSRVKLEERLDSVDSEASSIRPLDTM